jgi:hypothetical protein
MVQGGLDMLTKTQYSALDGAGWVRYVNKYYIYAVKDGARREIYVNKDLVCLRW